MADLTPAGRRSLQRAKMLVLTVQQARHDRGLPSCYRASIRAGAGPELSHPAYLVFPRQARNEVLR